LGNRWRKGLLWSKGFDMDWSEISDCRASHEAFFLADLQKMAFWLKIAKK
jgi:hypothetical protein